MNDKIERWKENERKEIKMIKKILRVTSIVITIFVFVLIWMHIDVT
ncbi:cardiolipin synthase, partial [Bacillus thuringiensis]|nr:cardiolipin synthase [Bacillus thuringiensis]